MKSAPKIYDPISKVFTDHGTKEKKMPAGGSDCDDLGSLRLGG